MIIWYSSALLQQQRALKGLINMMKISFFAYETNFKMNLEGGGDSERMIEGDENLNKFKLIIHGVLWRALIEI